MKAERRKKSRHLDGCDDSDCEGCDPTRHIKGCLDAQCRGCDPNHRAGCVASDCDGCAESDDDSLGSASSSESSWQHSLVGSRGSPRPGSPRAKSRHVPDELMANALEQAGARIWDKETHSQLSSASLRSEAEDKPPHRVDMETVRARSWAVRSSARRASQRARASA